MNTGKLAFALVTIVFISVGLAAQSNGQPPSGTNNFDQPGNRGRIIARELGLSDMQKLEIQQINQRQRLLLRDAQEQLRTARAAADAAIYSDVMNEADIGSKIQAVAVAQAEITKIRMMSEVAVRNVLSPEQLVKFRALRERFVQQRRRAERRRQNAPLRREMRRNPKPDAPPPSP